MFLFLLSAVNDGNDSISLTTIVIILVIVALLVFIFRGIRR